MKISGILKRKRTLSFEVFPPKEDRSLRSLSATLKSLAELAPDFISCTYGAGGTNVGRSLEVCKMVMDDGFDILTHFTCIGNTGENIDEQIKEYIKLGVENVLLLRGDLPEGWSDTRSGFDHASNLISYFKEKHPNIGIAAAAYPEAHMESPTVDDDIKYLKLKQDLGAEFFVTQLCHDVKAYDKFIKRIRGAGITIPVIIGLMPILTHDGTIRMSLTNGCSIPAELSRIMGSYNRDKEAFRKAGKEFTIDLIEQYLQSDIDGIHLYTLNKHEDIQEIIDRSGLISKLN